ncbi:MAG: hypothetical protein J6Z04_06465 [Clostridia bacterium]|nr:hypothetical protein [Clostridia bacterium]
MIYVVNTNTERVGTESDTAIIRSLVDRGYIVVVLDYGNDDRATPPALENRCRD